MFTEAKDVGVNEFVEGINEILSIYGNGTYVLVCSTNAGSEWDQALQAAFGDHYIRNSKDIAEMKEDDYLQLAETVYENLKEQGLFDAIIQAVKTAQTSLDDRIIKK